MKSLRILLTPTERTKPWLLYLTPGLLNAEIAHITVVVLIITPFRRWLLPLPAEPGSPFPELSSWSMGFYMIVVMITTVILTPLEVMGVRLAIQRNHASAEYNSVAQEVDGDAEPAPEYSGVEEDVIG